MPPLMHFLGALVATYFVSRLAYRMIKNWGTRLQRTVVAHLLSLAFLGVLVGWLESSPFSITQYLPWQVLWLVVDVVRQQPSVVGSSSRRRRRSGSDRDTLIGRGIAVVVGAVAAAYVSYGFLIFAWQSITLAEVSVDHNRQDVFYVLGAPTFVRASKNDGWSRGGADRPEPEWLYTSPYIKITFDQQNGLVNSMSCRESPKTSDRPCPNTLGVGVGDMEWDLEAALGDPSSTHLLSGGKKVMRYSDVGHDFVLEQFRVTMVRVYPDSGNSFRKLWRFLAWLLP
jgi:hypothetical protein